MSTFYGMVTRKLYFLKKYDTKWLFFLPCRNCPLCGTLFFSEIIIHILMYVVPSSFENLKSVHLSESLSVSIEF